MTKEQFSYGRGLIIRVNKFLTNQRTREDVYDLLDDTQLAFNEGRICREDYEWIMERLTPYIN